MPESVNARMGHSQIDKMSERQLRALLASIVTDLTSIATQFNQLRTDYNANATIATDTTATAISLNTTA